MTHAEVLVPSRQRAGRVKAEVLSLNPILVVEAWERDAYRAAYPSLRFLVLKERDRGIAYARNAALDFARARGWSSCWLLDDDLTDFIRRVPHPEKPRRQTRVPVEVSRALFLAEQALKDGPSVAMAGIAAGWVTKAPEQLTYNANVACCVRYDLASFGDLRFRETLRLGEDTDMALQCILGRRGTVRLNDFDYATPFWGTNTGGCQDDYEDLAAKAAYVQQLVSYWPGIVRAKPGATRYDIDWSALSEGRSASTHAVPGPGYQERSPSSAPGCYVGATATRGGR